MLARLRDGGTIEQAEAAARELAVRNIAADREDLIAGWATLGQAMRLRSPTPIKVHAVRYYHEPIYSKINAMMVLIIGSGLCVVLIACANVANLLLVRGAGAARRSPCAWHMAHRAGASSCS